MTINRLRLGNLPIKDPIYMFPSSNIPVYMDASGVHTARNRLQRGAGVYLPNGSLVRFVWPGNDHQTWLLHDPVEITDRPAGTHVCNPAIWTHFLPHHLR